MSITHEGLQIRFIEVQRAFHDETGAAMFAGGFGLLAWGVMLWQIDFWISVCSSPTSTWQST